MNQSSECVELRGTRLTRFTSPRRLPVSSLALCFSPLCSLGLLKLERRPLKRTGAGRGKNLFSGSSASDCTEHYR